MLALKRSLLNREYVCGKMWTAQEANLMLTYLSLPQGHDTTSAGMCWSVFLLGLHPDVQVSFNSLEGLF
jgi:cytochrome P450